MRRVVLNGWATVSFRWVRRAQGRKGGCLAEVHAWSWLEPEGERGERMGSKKAPSFMVTATLTRCPGCVSPPSSPHPSLPSPLLNLVL